MFVHRQENITISQCDFALCRRNQLKRYKATGDIIAITSIKEIISLASLPRIYLMVTNKLKMTS